jgi:hypothetical protein
MAVFVSNPASVTLTAPNEPYRRADVELHGVDHSKASYEGRLFINNPGADPETPTTHDSYIGSFWIFGHGGCAGEEGHCEPPLERRANDFRPEHQLTPMSKRVIVTDKLKTLVPAGQEFLLRIVPIVRPEHAEELPSNLVSDLLQFDRVDLLAYQ